MNTSPKYLVLLWTKKRYSRVLVWLSLQQLYYLPGVMTRRHPSTPCIFHFFFLFCLTWLYPWLYFSDGDYSITCQWHHSCSETPLTPSLSNHTCMRMPIAFLSPSLSLPTSTLMHRVIFIVLYDYLFLSSVVWCVFQKSIMYYLAETSIVHVHFKITYSSVRIYRLSIMAFFWLVVLMCLFNFTIFLDWVF